MFSRADQPDIPYVTSWVESRDADLPADGSTDAAARHFTGADEDNLFELNSDPEVMRFLTGGRPTPRDKVRTRTIPAFLAYYERFEGFGFWAAQETAAGQFLGWFHFRPPLPQASPPAWLDGDQIELGYRLRRSAWGKGYASEGSRALIDKGFAEFGPAARGRGDNDRQLGLPARAGEVRLDVRRHVLV